MFHNFKTFIIHSELSEKKWGLPEQNVEGGRRAVRKRSEKQHWETKKICTSTRSNSGSKHTGKQWTLIASSSFNLGNSLPSAIPTNDTI